MGRVLVSLVLLFTQTLPASASPLYLCLCGDRVCIDGGPQACECCHDCDSSPAHESCASQCGVHELGAAIDDEHGDLCNSDLVHRAPALCDAAGSRAHIQISLDRNAIGARSPIGALWLAGFHYLAALLPASAVETAIAIVGACSLSPLGGDSATAHALASVVLTC